MEQIRLYFEEPPKRPVNTGKSLVQSRIKLLKSLELVVKPIPTHDHTQYWQNVTIHWHEWHPGTAVEQVLEWFHTTVVSSYRSQLGL